MRVVMESIFDIAYLILVITLGTVMIVRAKGNKQTRLFGILALTLGCGDAFHLVPRVIALVQDSMEQSAAPLGFGKLVTSVTMTVFYVMLYHYLCRRYDISEKSPVTVAVTVLAVCRVALCLFPHNAWLSADAPVSWGIYRNIPFTVLGLLMVVFLYTEAKKHQDRFFRFGWLAVLLSFLFYIPVVLWADSIPIIGLLMLPKTVCYVWLVLMGYRAAKAEQG